ncbi:hypothetical protein KEM48_008837 [Puccinia striiformis f. sp. tritici PST-130]|nr:hypothetical protein KEM48_008837 [Puccinia striiformis f. sp. tritici PST-130]
MDSHKKSARHRTKLAQLNAFYQMTAAGLGGSTHQNRPDRQSPPGGPPSDIDIEDDYIPAEQDDESLSEEDDDQGIDPGQFGYRHDESDSESDGRLDEEDWSWSGEQTLGEDFEPNEQDIPTTGSTSRPQNTRRVPASSPWYPFPSLDHLIGSLILGQLHSIMSRNLYNHLRVILTLRHVNLPHWDTLRRMRSRMRSMLKMEPSENQSVLLNKTFTLNVQSIVGNELANPIVAQHLEFYPHDPRGKDVFALYQSQKWREELGPDSRVQMVPSEGKHFYIYEPPKGGLRANAPAGSRQFDLHLPSIIPWFHPDLIEIPVDQFQKTYSELTTYYGDSYVELCGNRFIACGSGFQKVDIPIPNPWRVHACGKIIRHVPVTLYADNTSGNKSKRWNKHAGPLEIGEPIIEQIKLIVSLIYLTSSKLSQEGCVTYDALLEEEVLMVVVPLCFLADSPMAAEVTNTPNPGSSNNPCRVCHLKCPQGEVRSTISYIQDFFGIPQLPEPRHWSETQTRTEELWMSSQTDTVKEQERKLQLYGLRDRISLELAERKRDNLEERLRIIQIEDQTPHRKKNPWLKLLSFDGTKDTPVEVLHVILLGPVKYLWRDFMGRITPTQLPQLEARWRAFNTDGLNIPPIQPRYMIAHWKSFVGKEFRVVLQAAPFVMFPFMDTDLKLIWSALCALGSYVFQTCIKDMDTYIRELKNHIQHFEFHLVKMSGRWANKPKIHMIIHLEESILRFGPASLFATEKFKSFNGIVRENSIHSNRLSPGRDIAIAFCDAKIMRLLMSGARLYDHETKRYFKSSPQVTNLFKNNFLIQKSMGYQQERMTSFSKYPCQHGHRGPQPSTADIPEVLRQHYPNCEIMMIAALNLNEKNTIRPGSFVLEKHPFNPHGSVGFVDSIWEVGLRVFYAKINKCIKIGIQQENSMTILSKEGRYVYVPVEQIICTLNVQHDCFSGKCPTFQTTLAPVGRQEGTTVTQQLLHTNNNRYLLNAYSHHVAECHRNHSEISVGTIPESMKILACRQGLYKWEQEKDS